MRKLLSLFACLLSAVICISCSNDAENKQMKQTVIDTVNTINSILEDAEGSEAAETVTSDNADGKAASETVSAETTDSKDASESVLEDTHDSKKESETVPSDNIDSKDSAGTASEENTKDDKSDKYLNFKFRSDKLLTQHYEKHGRDMGFSSKKAYEKAACDVINNPKALHKTEAEDGDYVFYVEDTNEFVILSTDGFIRTYFLPDSGKKYYDRQ